ncbi:MAG: POTRA domain-containing protein [Pseudomonadota bacterium]
MSFLRLNPASRRLRQAANACAAGEMATPEYRRLRREIIEELDVEFSAQGIDRFRLGGANVAELEDATLPRDTDTDVPIVTSVVSTPATKRHSRPPRRGLLVALIAGIALFALALAAVAAEIPPVSERDPNPATAPLLPVEALALDAAPNLPPALRAALDERLTGWLSEARASAVATGEHGFRTDELAEVGHLLARLGAHDGALPETTVVALNALLARQRERRGVTLLMLEEIAGRVEAEVRAAGYLAARAFVPAQTLIDGRATIRVLEGRMAGVVAEGAAPPAAFIERSAAALIDQPAHGTGLADLMYRFNALPGLQASGALRAGADVGDTELGLSFVQRSRFEPALRLDNHGDDSTSRYRLRGELAINNLAGRGDQLRLALSQRFEPESATGGMVDYRLPARRAGDELRLLAFGDRFSRRDGTDGDHLGMTAGFDRLLTGSRRRTRSLGVRASVERLGFADAEQSVGWIEPRAATNLVFDRARWVLQGSAAATLGTLFSGRFAGQSDTFARLAVDAEGWRPLGRHRLVLSGRGQLGTDDLPDSLKLSFGTDGAAVGPGAFIADRAIGLGAAVEIRPPAAWGHFELGAHWQRGRAEFGATSGTAHLLEARAGWHSAPLGPVGLALQLGVPIDHSGLAGRQNSSGGFDDVDSLRVLLRLSVQP